MRRGFETDGWGISFRAQVTSLSNGQFESVPRGHWGVIIITHNPCHLVQYPDNERHHKELTTETRGHSLSTTELLYSFVRGTLTSQLDTSTTNHPLDTSSALAS